MWKCWTPSHSDGTIELLMVRLWKKKQLVAHVYRPPGSERQKFAEIAERVKEKLKEYNTKPHDVLFLGDFNLPIIKWPSGKTVGGTKEDQEQAKLLLEIVEENFLEQIVNEPIRKLNILDLIFVSNVELIHSKKMLKTILSDNNLVEFITNTEEEMTNRLEIRNNIENGLNSLNFLHKTINWNSNNEELSKTN